MKLTRVSLTVHLLISSIRTFNWKILPRLLAVIIVQHKIWFCTIIVQDEIPSYTHLVIQSYDRTLFNRSCAESVCTHQLWSILNSRSCKWDIRSFFRFSKFTIIVRVKNRDRTLVWSKKFFIRISFDRKRLNSRSYRAMIRSSLLFGAMSHSIWKSKVKV